MAGIILTHDRADFDALASCVAAHLLYPDSLIFLNPIMPNPVREYLAIHGDVFPVLIGEDLPEAMDFLILVDAQNPRHFGKYRDFLLSRPPVRTIVFDHHPHDPEGVPADEGYLSPVGATITIMVRFLREKNLSISPLYATLFALGVYSDTGFLTYPQTTEEDIQAVLYMLQNGADLGQVRFYLLRAISEETPNQVEEVLSSRETYIIRGHRVVLFQTESAVGDLSILVSRLQQVIGAGTLFLLARSNHDVLVLGRTEDPSLDLSQSFRNLGGGGHRYAVSARLRHTSLSEAQFALLKSLEESFPQAITAWEVMSYPVEGILTTQTVQEAGEKMETTGHSGLLVWNEEGKPVGIITRKDLDRARKMKVPNIRVGEVMSAPIITVSPDVTIEHIQEIFARKRIGRVIVTDETNTPIGIVTRTDLLKAMGRVQPGISLYPLMQEMLSADEVQLLRSIGEIAQNMGMKCALVGGPARDLILRKPIKDWDFLVEGNALLLAGEVAHFFSGELQTHSQFHTARVRLKRMELDFATARTEEYPSAAELPRVSPSSIIADLLRRDFTINALAILLNPKEFGLLIDPVRGWDDLQNGLLRILHNLSFLEDPSRILRIIRYKSRFGFRIEENTERLLRRAISAGMLKRLSPDRLRNELFRCLKEKQTAQVLRELHSWGVFSSFFPQFVFPSSLFEPEDRIAQALQELAPSSPSSEITYFLALGSEVPLKLRRKFFPLFRLDKKTQKASDLISRLETFWQKLLTATSSSSIYFLLKDVPVEVQVVLLAKYPELKEKIRIYQQVLQHTRLRITGDDLVERGFPEGPDIGWVLRQVLRLRLDDKILPEEELETAIRLLRERKRRRPAQ
ncbi:MAG: CBS domain-containing protein [bacterium JZ-2024 1]